MTADTSVEDAREQLVRSVDRVLEARAAVAVAEEQLRARLGRAAPAGVAFAVIEAQLGRLAATPPAAPAAIVPPARTPDDEKDLGKRLAGCATKKDALELLYRLRVRPGDPRSRNAVTEALLAELLTHGITLDRGSANRYVERFRAPGPGSGPVTP
ncbi:hypothetical protein [Kitasatospora sp. MY 5-36]|uniref:hypothetical protein n=1 Tax=Kitasatospora sp. MY 5-36 TaxID=1678027 RepID=UPI0006717EA6|nr:hypothetical protein [Kitasatospora sp. MY 5-36]